MIGREGVLPGPPRTGPSPSSGISEGGGLIHAPPGGLRIYLVSLYI